MQIPNRLSVILFIFSVLSCTKDQPIDTYQGTTVAFILEQQHNPELNRDIPLYRYEGGTMRALVPPAANGNDYTVTLKLPRGTRLWVDEVPYSESHIALRAGDVLYCRTIDADNVETTHQVQLFPDAGLPVFWVETEGHQTITSKEDYLNAVLYIDPGILQQKTRSIRMGIRGRGNSTWGLPKKPYRMKFDEKESVFGSAEMKSWVLLANYADKTLLRNHIAFEIGRQLSESFVPSTQFVEIYVNGSYEGVYHLTDQVQVNKNRVSITELEGTEDEPISGGYLLEIDERLDADTWFRSPELHIPFTFKGPDIPTAAQLQYVQHYIQDLENILVDQHIANRTDDYEQLIDIESFVNYYLVAELSKNNDAAGFSSIFIVKPENGKLQMGPPWDYDIAFGNISWDNNDNPEGWWIKTSSRWYYNLFRDPHFKGLVKTRWNEVKVDLQQHILQEIDRASGALSIAQQRNFNRWDILQQELWPNYIAYGSYAAEVAQLVDWINKRFAWMDSQISTW